MKFLALIYATLLLFCSCSKNLRATHRGEDVNIHAPFKVGDTISLPSVWGEKELAGTVQRTKSYNGKGVYISGSYTSSSGTFRMFIAKDSSRYIVLDHPDEATYYELSISNNHDSNPTSTTKPYKVTKQMYATFAAREISQDTEEADTTRSEGQGQNLVTNGHRLLQTGSDYSEEGPNRLELMLVYTQKALEAVGGTAAMFNRCVMAVESFNDALSISGVENPSMNVEMVIVHIYHSIHLCHFKSNTAQTF